MHQENYMTTLTASQRRIKNIRRAQLIQCAATILAVAPVRP
jgi:hypothetical protein